MEIKEYKAKSYQYQIIRQTDNGEMVYPYLRAFDGDKKMYCISTNHGRSYLVGKNNDGRYVISKGNGLSYSQYLFLHTGEMGNDTIGLLLEQDAIRDFTLGIEIEKSGIKTNRMEYVLKLDYPVVLTNGSCLNPVLLQYSVECPWRINDAAFCLSEIKSEVLKWERPNTRWTNKYHLMAADVLIQNLRVLHDNNILHNAISPHNVTWALELVDFELACSPQHPYSNEDYNRHVKDLFNREIPQTYEIIIQIAAYLNEKIDYGEVERIFENYGFSLSNFSCQ